jgi:hypothetical protein
MYEDTPPCVIFAFNRPQKLGRVLHALKIQDVNRLVIFVDGPRRENETALVEQCRKIAREVNWAETELHIWAENHGLKGVLDNIDLVMEEYPTAIFVEDDCLPLPSFLDFMQEALVHYQEEKSVFSISAYQLLPRSYFRGNDCSLVSSARFTCWGWATWRDRWKEIRGAIDQFETLFEGLSIIPNTAGPDLPVTTPELVRKKKLVSWDIKVAIATLWLKKVHLLPTQGRIKNIGQDIGGMHSSKIGFIRSVFLQNKNLVQDAPGPVNWLDDVSLNFKYTSNLNEYLRRVTGLTLKQNAALLNRTVRRTLLRHPPRFENVIMDRSGRGSFDKRALVSYITYPFSIPEGDPRFYRHINIWHAREIVRCLNRMGYAVDVIDYRDQKFVPGTPYELFIGHGGINFTHIANQLPSGALKIYFSTGAYWQYHNQAEKKRFEWLRQRRGVELPMDRVIRQSEEESLREADGIIAIGNQFTRETYSKFDNIHMVPITALYDDRMEWSNKDYEQGRQHFLYFAGGGCVHKGLDLLLEAFAESQLHLWVCSRMDPEFEQIYSKELYSFNNIHKIGLIQPREYQFYEIMRQCNYVILPSCSEGSAHSVVECMNQGLIPVVSKASGINLGNYGFLLEPPSIEEIRRVVMELACLPVDRCQELSSGARRAAHTVYSENAFSSHMQLAVETILGKVKA